MKIFKPFLLMLVLAICAPILVWGAFPTTLTNAVDGETEIFASHLNNLEAKVGIDSSSVTTSLDYMLRSGSSINPGHKHTPPYGGTGIYTYVIGDLLYASNTSVLSRLAGVATGNALISGGIGVAPAWGKVGLTAHVSGILGSANGGTGNGFTKFTGPTTAEKTFTLPDASATILTTNAAVTAAQGGTGQLSYAVGDLLYASAASALSKLADVAVGQVLVSGGVGVAPAWGKVALTTHISEVLPVANGGTGYAGADWTDYSSTSVVTGWAATPTVLIYYMKVGRMVHVSFDITGTSNATTITFSLPYVAATGSKTSAACVGADAGTHVASPALVNLSPGEASVTIYKDWTGGLPWTNSGAKSVWGSFIYVTN
jgi:hypothetical protein